MKFKCWIFIFHSIKSIIQSPFISVCTFITLIIFIKNKLQANPTQIFCFENHLLTLNISFINNIKKTANSHPTYNTPLMYFTKQQITSNINSQYGINQELQLSLTNGNVQFIIQLSRQMKISYTIPSLALHISQIFFQKKCYLFYDRFLILTASFALASKLKDMDCRLKSVCNSYYNIISRMTMNYEPFNEEKMRKIKDQICIAQTQILRTLEYKIDFYTPHDYLKKYVQTLAQPKQTIRKVYNSSRIIILDSYRSKCCLLYNPLTISIAALLIASRYQGFRPYVCEMVKEQLKNQQLQSKPIEKEESQQGEIGKDQQHDLAKNQLNNHQQLYKCWIKMIKDKEDEDLKEADILDCIKMINSVIFDTLKHWN